MHDYAVVRCRLFCPPSAGCPESDLSLSSFSLFLILLFSLFPSRWASSFIPVFLFFSRLCRLRVYLVLLLFIVVQPLLPLLPSAIECGLSMGLSVCPVATLLLSALILCHLFYSSMLSIMCCSVFFLRHDCC